MIHEPPSRKERGYNSHEVTPSFGLLIQGPYRRQYLLFDSPLAHLGHLPISSVGPFLGSDSRITMRAFHHFLQQLKFTKRSLLRAVCIFCSRMSTP